MVAQFYGPYLETLLAVEYAALRVMLKKSLIKNPEAGRGIFPARWFRRRNIFGFYYASLVYENMTPRQQTTKTYGKAFM